MKKSQNYKEILKKRLKSPEEAASYLNAALEDEDSSIFLIALKDIADANGGMSHLAKECHLSRESLYRTLSKKGNPTLCNLRGLLGVIGLDISINPSNNKKSV